MHDTVSHVPLTHVAVWLSPSPFHRCYTETLQVARTSSNASFTTRVLLSWCSFPETATIYIYKFQQLLIACLLRRRLRQRRYIYIKNNKYWYIDSVLEVHQASLLRGRLRRRLRRWWGWTRCRRVIPLNLAIYRKRDCIRRARPIPTRCAQTRYIRTIGYLIGFIHSRFTVAMARAFRAPAIFEHRIFLQSRIASVYCAIPKGLRQWWVSEP
jgi:hypothetical protein